MPTCASETCSNKLDKRKVHRDWCSDECWEQGQDEMREELRRYREENPKPPMPARTLSDEEEVLGQPVRWMPWKS